MFIFWYYLIKFIIFLLPLNYPIVVNNKKRYKYTRNKLQGYYKRFNSDIGSNKPKQKQINLKSNLTNK